jgi:hypothetical protein
MTAAVINLATARARRAVARHAIDATVARLLARDHPWHELPLWAREELAADALMHVGFSREEVVR